MSDKEESVTRGGQEHNPLGTAKVLRPEALVDDPLDEAYDAINMLCRKWGGVVYIRCNGIDAQMHLHLSKRFAPANVQVIWRELTEHERAIFDQTGVPYTKDVLRFESMMPEVRP